MKSTSMASGGFEAHDCGARLRLLRDLMAEKGFESFLVTDVVNLRYLTGFTGSSGYALVTQDHLWFMTDGRYDEQCRLELANSAVDAEICITGPLGIEPVFKRVVAESGTGAIALEACDVTWQFQIDVASWLDRVTLQPASDLVEGMRMRKSSAEIARMRSAAEIGDAAFEYILDRIEPGRSEIEIARELERCMIDSGAQALSFDAIVAAGSRSAMPHAHPGSSVLKGNEVVLMDFGCIVDGYCSDMTRTVFLGTPPAKLDDVYGIVYDAQAAGVSAVASDASCSVVDSVCRQLISDAGYGDDFSHSTGHGVGLEIHEEPRLSQTSTAILASGHVVTIEPGIYLTGIGGVRIEDMVAVTDGEPAVLTSSPKELIVL